MADYPVLDGADNPIIPTDKDPAHVSAPYDYSADYPVRDGAGELIISFARDPALDLGGDAVMVLYLLGASNEHGPAKDDVGATRTAEDTVATGGYWINPNTNPLTLEPIDQAADFPRSGASVGITTNPAPNLVKALQAGYTQGDLTVLVLPIGFGGQGVFEDGDVAGYGPMHPDGPSAAFPIGGSIEDANNSGALYKFATAASTVAAVDALINANYPSHTRIDGLAFGKVANENDTTGRFEELVELSKRFVQDMRTAWGEEFPVVLNSVPPPFSFDGAVSSRKYSAAYAALAQRLTKAAYVELSGEPQYQHGTEPIHVNNPGSRVAGTRAHLGKALAEARSVAPLSWTRLVDDLVEKPVRVYSTYRLVGGYAGAAMKVNAAAGDLDIGFLSNDWLDTDLLLTHANGGDGSIVEWYDQMGSANHATPEGTGSAKIVKSGELVFQGRRLAWGDDESNILMKAGGVTTDSTGAVCAVGRLKDTGNGVLVDVNNRALTIYSASGPTRYAVDASFTELDEGLEYEPSFITDLAGAARGYNVHACYLDANGLRVNGQARSGTAASGTSTGVASTLCMGGRSGVTNRYGRGSYVAFLVFANALTGADLARMDAFCAAIGGADDLA